MWGNRLGWTISMLIVLATVAGLVYLSRLDHVTLPTALSADSRNRSPLQLPRVASIHAPDESSPPADAGELIRQAIAAYRADPSDYDQAGAGNAPRKFASLPGIAPLLATASSNDSDVLAPLADEVVTFKSPRAPLDAVQALGKALIGAALASEQRDPDAARRYHLAAFSLGEKLFRERLVYAELMAGMKLMSESAVRLAKLEPDPQRSAEWTEFETARRQLAKQRIAPLWQVIASIDPGVISRHAGDVLALAGRCDERLWRVEAVLALGRYRFGAPRPRDREAARKLLDELVAFETDPIVRRAARAASDMTIEDYRMLR